MEDTLRAPDAAPKAGVVISLNPYSNGRYSESVLNALNTTTELGVLILILMEDTLRV